MTIGFDETDIRVMEDGGNIFVAVSLLQLVAAPVSVDISYIPGSADTNGRSNFIPNILQPIKFLLTIIVMNIPSSSALGISFKSFFPNAAHFKCYLFS